MSNEHPFHASRDHLKTVAERYHVMRQPGPLSRFTYNFSSIDLWCLPHNHPGGLWDWLDFNRHKTPNNPSGAEGLGDAWPILAADERTITAFVIQTKALPLLSQQLLPEDTAALLNRPDDVRWTLEQLRWLWEQAFPGTPLPPVSVTDWQADPSDLEDFADWVVFNAARKPGEPLSNLPPAKNPRPF
jgi:hypothetical protein